MRQRQIEGVFNPPIIVRWNVGFGLMFYRMEEHFHYTMVIMLGYPALHISLPIGPLGQAKSFEAFGGWLSPSAALIQWGTFQFYRKWRGEKQ